MKDEVGREKPEEKVPKVGPIGNAVVGLNAKKGCHILLQLVDGVEEAKIDAEAIPVGPPEVFALEVGTGVENGIVGVGSSGDDHAKDES